MAIRQYRYLRSGVPVASPPSDADRREPRGRSCPARSVAGLLTATDRPELPEPLECLRLRFGTFPLQFSTAFPPRNCGPSTHRLHRAESPFLRPPYAVGSRGRGQQREVGHRNVRSALEGLCDGVRIVKHVTSPLPGSPGAWEPRPRGAGTVSPRRNVPSTCVPAGRRSRARSCPWCNGGPSGGHCRRAAGDMTGR